MGIHKIDASLVEGWQGGLTAKLTLCIYKLQEICDIKVLHKITCTINRFRIAGSRDLINDRIDISKPSYETPAAVCLYS